MYFDFEDYRPDISPVGRAISWREGILISIIAHMAMVILLLLAPKLFPFDEEAARARAAAIEKQLAREKTRFVFVQPRVDLKAPKPPERGVASDADRLARSPEQAKKPQSSSVLAREYPRTRRTDAARNGARPRAVPRTLAGAAGARTTPDPAARRHHGRTEAAALVDGFTVAVRQGTAEQRALAGRVAR